MFDLLCSTGRHFTGVVFAKVFEQTWGEGFNMDWGFTVSFAVSRDNPFWVPHIQYTCTYVKRPRHPHPCPVMVALLNTNAIPSSPVAVDGTHFDMQLFHAQNGK